MTVRELRTALFEIDNDEMTISELRQKLFNVRKQDVKIDNELWDIVNKEA